MASDPMEWSVKDEPVQEQTESRHNSTEENESSQNRRSPSSSLSSVGTREIPTLSPASQPLPEVLAPPTTKKMAQGRKKKAAATRTPRKSKWNADNILIDTKSPLATCDLRTVLSNPLAWDALDENDKAEILALFPDKEHILEDVKGDGARPNFQTLLNDDSFRHDCAAYTENVAEGRHDPEWLESAWLAHERRKAGDFDDYLVQKFEEDWGVKLPDEMKPKKQIVAAETPA